MMMGTIAAIPTTTEVKKAAAIMAIPAVNRFPRPRKIAPTKAKIKKFDE